MLMKFAGMIGPGEILHPPNFIKFGWKTAKWICHLGQQYAPLPLLSDSSLSSGSEQTLDVRVWSVRERATKQ